MEYPPTMYSYQQLNGGIVTGETSASGYYLQTQPINYSLPNENPDTVFIDTTTKQELKSYFLLSIITFGLFATCFTAWIFTFSFLWYSIVENYSGFKIACIIGISSLSFGMIFFLLLFINSYKNYKRICNSLFDRNIFLA